MAYEQYGAKKVEKLVAKQVRKELRGRPSAKPQSMQVLGGKLRVKLAKSREIRVGGYTVKS